MSQRINGSSNWKTIVDRFSFKKLTLPGKILLQEIVKSKIVKKKKKQSKR